MITINEETKKIKNPATPVVKSSPDTYQIAAVVSEKLDLTKAVTIAQLTAPPKPALRMIASNTSSLNSISENRKLWCYNSKHPRLRFLATNLSLKTLKTRSEKYAEELLNAYKESGIKTKIYTVKKGDTLRNLSRKIVGSPNIWIELYLLNRDNISDWDNLDKGTILKIPDSNNLPVSCIGSVAQTKQ